MRSWPRAAVPGLFPPVEWTATLLVDRRPDGSRAGPGALEADASVVARVVVMSYAPTERGPRLDHAPSPRGELRAHDDPADPARHRGWPGAGTRRGCSSPGALVAALLRPSTSMRRRWRAARPRAGRRPACLEVLGTLSRAQEEGSRLSARRTCPRSRRSSCEFNSAGDGRTLVRCTWTTPATRRPRANSSSPTSASPRPCRR